MQHTRTRRSNPERQTNGLHTPDGRLAQRRAAVSQPCAFSALLAPHQNTIRLAQAGAALSCAATESNIYTLDATHKSAHSRKHTDPNPNPYLPAALSSTPLSQPVSQPVSQREPTQPILRQRNTAPTRRNTQQQASKQPASLPPPNPNPIPIFIPIPSPQT